MHGVISIHCTPIISARNVTSMLKWARSIMRRISAMLKGGRAKDAVLPDSDYLRRDIGLSRQSSRHDWFDVYRG